MQCHRYSEFDQVLKLLLELLEPLERLALLLELPLELLLAHGIRKRAVVPTGQR